MAIRSLWLELELMAEELLMPELITEELLLDPELEPNLELEDVAPLATATAPLASSRPARGPSQAGTAFMVTLPASLDRVSA